MTKRTINLIELVNASKIYDNGVKGIKDISLTIKDGEFVFIVGPSGSGKSTIIKLLLKEEELTQGQLMLNGRDITKMAKKEVPYLRRSMGVVFQDFRLFPNKTVFENVSFALQIIQSGYREIRRKVPTALAMVGLQKKAKSYPHQLSGGEQQRTSLARAIVNGPPLLLADEPTGNLDPNTAREIMNLLENINKQGTTVIVATHAWDIVDTMQKRVVALKNGAVLRDVEEGISDEA